MSFFRHLQQEYTLIKKRAAFNNTFRIFPLIEVSLGKLLSSRACLRFPQLCKYNFLTLTQFSK